MMFKGTLLFLILMILAVPVTAQDYSTKKVSPLDPGKYQGELANPAFSGRSVFEGFEYGVPPLFGWNHEITNPAETWGQEGNGWGIEGEYCARMWRDMTVAQNEVLSFTHSIDVAAGDYILSFWAAGATGQSWDFGSAETVEINGVEVWNFDDEVPYGHHLEYFHYFVDLSEYDGETVTIGFRYEGIDGGAFFLDAVMIDDGPGWEPEPGPPGPANDTCEGAMDNGYFIPPGQFNISGDTTTAYHHYALTHMSCNWYGFHGPDLVWVVCMEEGDNLDVTMSGQDYGFDAVFFLITDCADPVGTCVAMGDEPEVINYTAETTDTYYLVAGGWSQTMVGPFTLNGTLTGAGCETVATDDTEWGALKALYR